MTEALHDTVNDLARDIEDVKKILDAIAQLLRDSQLTQAGNDKLTHHTRQQISAAVEDLRRWSVRADSAIEELRRRSSDLEEDHTNHTEALETLVDICRQNERRFEELLGLRIVAAPAPLQSQIHEILTNSRIAVDKNPASGEAVAESTLFWKQFKVAFWTAIATVALNWAARVVLPYFK